MLQAYKDDDGVCRVGDDSGLTIGDVSFTEDGNYVVGEVNGYKIRSRDDSDKEQANRRVFYALRVERARANPVQMETVAEFPRELLLWRYDRFQRDGACPFDMLMDESASRALCAKTGWLVIEAPHATSCPSLGMCTVDARRDGVYALIQWTVESQALYAAGYKWFVPAFKMKPEVSLCSVVLSKEPTLEPVANAEESWSDMARRKLIALRERGGNNGR